MNASSTYSGAGGYQLKSELARICLPAPHAHSRRHLAWTNSICLLFLVVGLAGFRSAPPPRIPAKLVEEPAPVVLEQAQLPPPVAELKQDEEQLPKKAEFVPPPVVVVRDTAAIKFAMPAIGSNVVLAERYSVTPPASLPEPAAPAATARGEPAQPDRLESTGQGGDRPAPPYPKLAEETGQQGSVELLLTADEAGVIISAEVREPSGSTILDSATVDFVKRHWTVSPGARGRLFQARITYKLTSN
jgi:protein TonB